MRIFHKGNILVSTILNIIGLTFAFAALYIILVQVHYDLTYNHAIKDSDRIYILGSPAWNDEGKYGTSLCRPDAESIIKSLPIVEQGGLLMPDGEEYNYFRNETADPFPIYISLASLEGIETFSYELIEGSWEDWTGKSLALSESTASELGLQIGDVVKIRSSNLFKDQTTEEHILSVIYKDMPENSDFSQHNGVLNIGNHDIDNGSMWNYRYYLKLKEGSSEKEINELLNQFLRNFFIEKYNASEDKLEELITTRGYKLFPLDGLYFNPIVKSGGRMGNKTTTFTLLGIAILIIIIAFVNYFNFFFALVPVRIKTINTRKILGSGRTRLIFSMIGESITWVVIAIGLSAIIVSVFNHTSYSNLISSSVLFNHNPGITFICVGTAMVVAVIASIFPAFYITSFNPALAIKGQVTSSGRGETYRDLLIGFQFTISIILIICAILINQQRKFMLNHDLGFDKENLYTVKLSMTAAQKRDMIETRLKDEPLIADVTWADGQIVSQTRMGWGRTSNDLQINFDVYPVAWNFLRFMNIPIVEGRDFEKSDEENESGLFIMNEEARTTYDLNTGDRIVGHRDYKHPAEIVGFAKGFRYKPLREKDGSFCFYMYGKNPWVPLNTLFIRTVQGVDPTTVKKKITHILNEADPLRNEHLWTVELMDDYIEDIYIKEAQLSKIINLFTLLAIVISLIGVFGLVMFETEGRKKEIGIRRINGASVVEILRMFNMKFIKIVIVSYIIAVPVSLWIITVYLESYAYKTPIYLWVFFVSLLAVLTITTGVVTLRSYKAAATNPVDSLSTE